MDAELEAAAPPPQGCLDARVLSSHRESLFRLCYRMTGSAAEADDLVQETFRRALETPPKDTTRDLRPWLVRVAVNLSRDALRARKRRSYAGTWLPSPIELPFDGERATPSGESRYSEVESVSFAFLVALEALSPKQRAVLLLRDVLDYTVEETADALQMSQANVKTALHRARRALQDYDARVAAPSTAHNRALEAALRALCVHLLSHNVKALEALLARDVCARNDGGGEFFAAQKPVFGLARVIKFHLKVMRRAPGRFAFRYLNGEPAVVADVPSTNPRIARRSIVRIELNAQGQITRIDTLVASEKLANIRFDDLQRPGLRTLGGMLLASVRHPPPRSWLPHAVRALLRGARKGSYRALALYHSARSFKKAGSSRA